METFVKIFSRRNICICIGLLFVLWVWGKIKYRCAISTDYIIIHHTAIKGDTTSILDIHDYHINTIIWKR